MPAIPPYTNVPAAPVPGMDAESAYEVRGYTLYRSAETHAYGLFRHAPAGAQPVPLPDGLRVVFDERGRPSLRAKLVPMAPLGTA